MNVDLVSLVLYGIILFFTIDVILGTLVLYYFFGDKDSKLIRIAVKAIMLGAAFLTIACAVAGYHIFIEPVSWLE